MSRIFDPENGFFTLINKIIDTFWLGVLWCVFGIAIPYAASFTGNNTIFLIACVIAAVLIGPSSTALYYAMVKVIRRSRSYATREFFHSFRDNFGIAAITSVVYSLFAFLMSVDIRYANALANEGNSFGNVMFAIFVAGCVFAGVSLVWIFPLLSRFTVKFGGLLRNALLIATKHLVRSFILVLIYAVIGVLAWAFRYYLMVLALFVPVLPGTVCLLRSFIIEPVLKKYTEASEGTPEETGRDEWYRE